MKNIFFILALVTSLQTFAVSIPFVPGEVITAEKVNNMNKSSDYSVKIEKAATLANAKIWANEAEQFIFCIDLLEISAHESYSDRAVDSLEIKFENLLK